MSSAAAFLTGDGADEPLIVNSPIMRAAVRELERLANEDARVAVCGESGAGVRWLCERIHRVSRRRNAPFVVLHEHDASVDAARAAAGGTLVLRVLDALSPEQQRLCEMKRDHRLILTCWTNGGRTAERTIAREVLDGCDAVVAIPALRSRREDIADLSRLFW